jgi:threonine aldolase
VDETGATENFTGCKLLTVPTRDGKITVEGMRKYTYRFGDEHYAQPKVISITQPTELGTVYTKEEIRAIASFAKERNLLLHMDGARISNAAVALQTPFREFTRDLGVDILSFGGTKNGLLFGEAILFFDSKLTQDFKFIRKQGLQLASKMRFISAQFEALLSNNLWEKNAKQANRMAKLLESEVRHIPQVSIVQKVETNVVFARLPKQIIPALQEVYPFYIWEETSTSALAEVRWMTSFDTTEEDVYNFAELVRKTVSGALTPP